MSHRFDVPTNTYHLIYVTIMSDSNQSYIFSDDNSDMQGFYIECDYMGRAGLLFQAGLNHPVPVRQQCIYVVTALCVLIDCNES